jgi:hypothetical protein
MGATVVAFADAQWCGTEYRWRGCEPPHPHRSQAIRAIRVGCQLQLRFTEAASPSPELAAPLPAERDAASSVIVPQPVVVAPPPPPTGGTLVGKAEATTPTPPPPTGKKSAPRKREVE